MGAIIKQVLNTGTTEAFFKLSGKQDLARHFIVEQNRS